MSDGAFYPQDHQGVSISVTGSSANVLVSPASGTVDVLIYNAGTAVTFIRAGGALVAAALTGDIPIAPGTTQTLKLANPAGGGLYVAAIAAGSNGTIYFNPGSGL
jgi:hypothetical protein